MDAEGVLPKCPCAESLAREIVQLTDFRGHTAPAVVIQLVTDRLRAFERAALRRGRREGFVEGATAALKWNSVAQANVETCSEKEAARRYPDPPEGATATRSWFRGEVDQRLAREFVRLKNEGKLKD